MWISLIMADAQSIKTSIGANNLAYLIGESLRQCPWRAMIFTGPQYCFHNDY